MATLHHQSIKYIHNRQAIEKDIPTKQSWSIYNWGSVTVRWHCQEMDQA